MADEITSNNKRKDCSESTPSFSIVVAVENKLGIGKDNKIPWRIPKDMEYFKELTSKSPEGTYNAVIMGRNTYDSFPAKFRPLPNRKNIVITENKSKLAGELVNTASSLIEALLIAQGDVRVADIFVIGGERVYREALEMSGLKKLYVTRVLIDKECSVFFPEFSDKLVCNRRGEVLESGGIKYYFEEWKLPGRLDKTKLLTELSLLENE